MKINKKYISFITISMLLVAMFASFTAKAGVALGATRVIYPANSKQVQLPILNNGDDSVYLIQSWIENSNSVKDGSFVITPPLFTIKGKKESKIRIIYSMQDNLPKDKESLFWLNVKAIPSSDKSTDSNKLQFAIVNKIKLFYRPTDLSMSPEDAYGKLEFNKTGSQLTINNPTPYYMTISEISIGGKDIDGIFIPPMDRKTVNLPSNVVGNDIKYKTINDYGALTPAFTAIAK